MRASSSADYDSMSRQIISKIAMYFTETPLEVTRDDYLVDLEVLYDLGMDKQSSDNSLKSNSLSFTITNQNQIFSPFNAASPYFGKIKIGMKIIAYMKPADDEVLWDKLGEFYVVDWKVSSDNFVVDITAYDNAYSFINDANLPDIGVQAGDTQAFMTDLLYDTPFDLKDVPSSTQFLFPLSTRIKTLNGLLQAQRMAASVGDNGAVMIGRLPLYTDETFLTDDNQIIDAQVQKDFVKKYDSSLVEYTKPELVFNETIVDIAELSIQPGTNIQSIVMSNMQLVNLDYIKITSPGPCGYTSEAYTSKINVNIVSAVAQTIRLLIIGTVVKLNKMALPAGDRTLKKECSYLQDKSSAEAYKSYLDTFLQTEVSTIPLTVRGNPLIKAGSLVDINSPKYGIVTKGVVVENRLTYSGGLKGRLLVVTLGALGGGI